MYGPEAKGHWTATLEPAPFGYLEVGRRYVVTRPFADFDGDVHSTGESWWFLGHNFVPYHDGLSLFVSLDGEDEWHIRLQWLPEGQGAVIDDLQGYVSLSAPGV